MNTLIMAGGSGSRFWPLSRQCRPKQFLTLWGEDTLLSQTVKRLQPVSGDNIFIVTGKEYYEMTRQQAPDVPSSNFILEPFGRNTAACIGLAAVKLCKMGKGDEVMVVSPADHLIKNDSSFRQTLIDAGQAAGSGWLVVIGVKPTGPNPNYGYIETGDPIDRFPGLHSVKRFVEKPSRERAGQMLEIGGYNWNAGIFLWTPDTIIEAVRKHMPDLYKGLETIRSSLGTEEEEKIVEKVYRDLPSIPIDIGVLERSERLAVIGSEMEWCDVGNWSSLCNVLELDQDENFLKGKSVAHNSRRCLLFSSGRLVATVGLEGVAVIETDDAVLVCNLEKDHELKELLEKLDREGHGECR